MKYHQSNSERFLIKLVKFLVSQGKEALSLIRMTRYKNRSTTFNSAVSSSHTSCSVQSRSGLFIIYPLCISSTAELREQSNSFRMSKIWSGLRNGLKFRCTACGKCCNNKRSNVSLNLSEVSLVNWILTLFT
jgi:hypothetical protein